MRVWRLDSGGLEARIPVAGNPVAAAFSNDEREIAIAAGERVEARVWRLDDLMRLGCQLLTANGSVPPWSELVAEPRFRKVCAGDDRDKPPARPG